MKTSCNFRFDLQKNRTIGNGDADQKSKMGTLLEKLRWYILTDLTVTFNQADFLHSSSVNVEYLSMKATPLC